MADILTQLQTCLDQVFPARPTAKHKSKTQNQKLYLTKVKPFRIQLATQFYATLCYLSTYHDHSAATPPPNVPTAIPQLKKIPKNPPPATSASAAEKAAGRTAASPQPQQPNTPAAADAELPAEPTPDSPEIFAQRQRELARDLIVKEQQIEYLISVLPGVGSSEAEQEERIRQLAEELRIVEAERRVKRKEMRKLGERVDELLGAVEGRG
ncbi:hypothetical protein AJ78_07720 [Emergomyces pasteurianus Ep9510]|uniref:Mediator of RNA polymerase II transcription subunit 21 n=1 Tax=Emergomyces pasteurianus Ep9510 TaxID=1447872 RepID=A0A1J9P469_9EURO|nr:hypothetical protein AJ78_07720 [Emergomyces pasteurianus Ep9510]